MADKQTGIVGLVGLLGIGIAVIAPHEIDKAKAEQYASESTKLELVAEGRKTVLIDSITGKDTIKVERQVYVGAQHKFNPLHYFSGDSVEITARNLRSDSMLLILHVKSPTDTTTLMDINVNFQPSAPPKEQTIALDTIGE